MQEALSAPVRCHPRAVSQSLLSRCSQQHHRNTRIPCRRLPQYYMSSFHCVDRLVRLHHLSWSWSPSLDVTRLVTKCSQVRIEGWTKCVAVLSIGDFLLISTKRCLSGEKLTYPNSRRSDLVSAACFCCPALHTPNAITGSQTVFVDCIKTQSQESEERYTVP